MTEPASDPPRDGEAKPILPPQEEIDELPRRHPSTIGGACYLVVLVLVGIGLFIVTTDDWRQGAKWIGGALVLAALLRLVLRSRDAGMLAVRHRLVDALLLSGVGVAVIFLSESIPNQPF